MRGLERVLGLLNRQRPGGLHAGGEQAVGQRLGVRVGEAGGVLVGKERLPPVGQELSDRPLPSALQGLPHGVTQDARAPCEPIRQLPRCPRRG